MTDSVLEIGVIQPILIRCLDGDGFELVAGERRYRAAQAAHGDDYPRPVAIKALTDDEVGRLALIENVQRADMAPSEEAAAAAKIVGQIKGDRDEAARVLGWSRATLDVRLALMNCSQSVRTQSLESRLSETARSLAANSRRWWHNSAEALHRVLTIACFDQLGMPRLT